VAALTDDYFRPEIDLDAQDDAALAPVGVFTGGVQLLQALYPEGIPVEAGRAFMLAVASTFFTPENIAAVFPERVAPPKPVPAPTGPNAPAPVDEEDSEGEPSEVDLLWSQNPLPADAVEAPKIAAEFGIPTVRVTRAHRAGLIEGWNVLGGKPRYSLSEVKRVVLQGNGKLPAAEPAPTGDKVRDAAARNEARYTVGVMLRAPKRVAQWVPYKSNETSAPHVTLLYVGKVHPQKVVPILDAVRRVLAETPALAIDFDGVDYFDNEQRVAFMRVRPTAQLSALHDALREAVAACGVDVAHVSHDYTPHLTLAYLEPGEDYTGPVPSEGWTATECEVWYDDLALPIACAEQPISDAGPEIDDAIDETLWLASCGDLSEEAKRERIDTAFARYHETVNMGAAELEAWAKTEWSRKASLDRTPIERNLRLLRKRKEDWTLADAVAAMRTVTFVSRMRGAEQGEPVKIDGREGPSKRDISLKNWAFDPAK
jgi:2'-5' RNA ligase